MTSLVLYMMHIIYKIIQRTRSKNYYFHQVSSPDFYSELNDWGTILPLWKTKGKMWKLHLLLNSKKKKKKILCLKIEIQIEREKGRTHTSNIHILIDSQTTMGSIKAFCCQSFKAWEKNFLKN